MGASIMPPPGQRCIVVDDLRLGVLHRRARVREAGAPGGVDHAPHVRARDAATARSDDLADHVSYSDVVCQAEGAGQVGARTSTWWRPWPRRRPISRSPTLAWRAWWSTCARPRSCRRPRASASSSTGNAARGEPMRPDVSVIMPAYRAAATIGRAVQSVFAQRGRGGGAGAVRRRRPRLRGASCRPTCAPATR